MCWMITAKLNTCNSIEVDLKGFYLIEISDDNGIDIAYRNMLIVGNE